MSAVAESSPALDDVPCRMALARVRGMSRSGMRCLLGAFPTAVEAWEASEASLASVLAGRESLCHSLVEARRRVDPRRLADEAARAGCHVLAWGCPGFPRALDDLKSGPLVLYLRGRADLLEQPSIAVVGTRRATEYGLKAAELFAGALAGAGLVIVSGMARGVDSEAHRAALRAGGTTVAVLGCGVDVCYPAENGALKRAIEEQGVVVSQFPPGAPPLGGHFPVRNRVIAALALGLVVVEAPTTSGAMDTAAHAILLERPLFAVPGSVFRTTLDGCHRLISEGVAGLASRPEDVLEGIGWRAPIACVAPGSRAAGAPEWLDEESLCVWRVLEQACREPSATDDALLEVEEITGRSGMASASVVRSLARMELQGILERRPGNLYTLARRAGRAPG